MSIINELRTTEIISLFNELGKNILKEWQKYGYSEDALSEVASDALLSASLQNKITAADIIELALNGMPSISSYQVDSPFGDLQLILFSHARFYIEVLYWAEGSTSIHDHAFSGAFQVLTGSSLNAEYAFIEEQKINHHFYLGDLSNPVTEHLSIGSIKPIYSGRRFIHSVFHLEYPTISIVVRTYQDDDAAPQFQYRGRKIRLVQEFTPELSKKIKGLTFLLNKCKNRFSDSILKLYCNSPLDEKYWLLRAFYPRIAEMEKTWADIKASSAVDKTRYLIESIEQEAIIYKVMRHRSNLNDSSFRYFVALLLNIPSWRGVLDYLKKNHRRDNSSIVKDWISTCKNLGLKLPNIESIDSAENINFTFDECEKIVTNENALFLLLKDRIGA